MNAGCQISDASEGYQMSATRRDQGRVMVCSRHLFHVFKAHLNAQYRKGPGREGGMKRQHIIHGLLWMVSLHECTPVDDDEPIANRHASLTTPAKPKPPDELTGTFSKARKYIQSDTFMCSFWMAALRHLLYLNHAPGFYTGGARGMQKNVHGTYDG